MPVARLKAITTKAANQISGATKPVALSSGRTTNSKSAVGMVPIRQHTMVTMPAKRASPRAQISELTDLDLIKIGFEPGAKGLRLRLLESGLHRGLKPRPDYTQISDVKS